MRRREHLILLIGLISFEAAGLVSLFLLDTILRGWIVLGVVVALPALVITGMELWESQLELTGLITEIENWLREQRFRS